MEVVSAPPLESNNIYLSKLRGTLSSGYGFPSGATQVFDFLYLGGEDEAMDKVLLQSLGITHIVNCAATYCHTGEKYYGAAIRKYVEFEAEDDEGYNIFQHFDEAFAVIEDARQTGGKALIHCLMGVNRSGALAVAYAMVHKQWGPITAASHVVKARKWLLSNDDFRAQLISFARRKNMLQLDGASDTKL